MNKNTQELIHTWFTINQEITNHYNETILIPEPHLTQLEQQSYEIAQSLQHLPFTAIHNTITQSHPLTTQTQHILNIMHLEHTTDEKEQHNLILNIINKHNQNTLTPQETLDFQLWTQELNKP